MKHTGVQYVFLLRMGYLITDHTPAMKGEEEEEEEEAGVLGFSRMKMGAKFTWKVG